MNLKKITAMVTALGVTASMFVPSMSVGAVDEQNITYDFSAFTSDNGYSKTSLNGSLSGFEGLNGTLDSLASSGSEYVKLSSSKSTTNYIEFTTTDVFTLSFTSSHANMSKGTLITNTQTGAMYTTSSKDDKLVIKNLSAGTYRVSGCPAGSYYDMAKNAEKDFKANNAYISSMTITYGEYIESTVEPAVTVDPNATETPAPTAKPTTDPSIPSELAIIDCEPWFESVYVAWTNTREVDKYNVYIKKSTDDEYTKLDDELIRRYDTYYRADALGLAEGTYTVKVAAVIAGQETDTVQTGEVQVVAHNRDGFAHDPKSPNKTASGGYNDDGTPRSDAVIIYADKNNINTIALDVVVNNKGTAETKVGLAEIMSARQKGYDKTPLIIRYIGHIPGTAVSGLNSAGYIQVKGCYNVTMEGVGDDTILDGWSFLIRDANNIEIRNFGIKNFVDDGISLDTNNTNIWVHNNDIFYGKKGSGDKAKGDGSCDVKGNSTYVTVSYNHFWDSGKCSLCGMTQDKSEFFVTYHHNWFDHSDSRHPRIRTGTVHVYNNYFDGNAKYGVGVTMGSSAFVEANYFRNCLHPMLASLQGTDAMGDGTFSGETGGIIKAYNNAIIGGKPMIDAKDNASFDAYFADTRDEKVPSSYVTVSGNTTYNNFDTAETMYSYTPDAPANVPAVVEMYAGRFGGGSFEFEFDDSTDDTSYAINSKLVSAVSAHTSAVVQTYLNSGEDYPSVKPGATAAPDKTPVPTPDPNATIEPTSTPSPTPIPTATPTPSPTPDPDATPAPTLRPSSSVTAVGNGIHWSANDFAEGTYGETIYHNGLEIGANDTSTIVVDANKATIGSTTYTKRIKMSGKGAADTGVRCIAFTPDADCTMTIDATSSNAETARTIVVAQNSGSHDLSVLAKAGYTVENLKANETVYIYSVSGGWNVYGITLKPTSGSTTDPTTTPDPTDPPEAAVKITATYDENGRLTGITTENVFGAENGSSDDTAGTKVFVWYSLESMKPYTD